MGRERQKGDVGGKRGSAVRGCNLADEVGETRSLFACRDEPPAEA